MRMKTLAIAALLCVPLLSAKAETMTYVPTTGTKPVTEQALKIPLRLLNPLSLERCQALQ